MDIKTFRGKYPQYNDVNDQDLANKFYNKYYSDLPKDKFMQDFLGEPTQTQQQSTQQPQAFGGLMRGVARAAAPYTREALPMAGALAGGALAAPTGPIGALGGAGLGYAGGSQLQDVIEQYGGVTPTKSTGQELMEMPKDILTGAAMEAGGGIAGKAIGGALKYAGKVAPRLYESIAKIPPRSIPKMKRDAAIRTAMKYKIPATEKGLSKSRGMINETNEKIASVIDDLGQPAQEPKTKYIMAKDFDKFKPQKNINDLELGEWFKNSKVLDPVGNPKVVYHWSDSGFDKFSKEKLGKLTAGNTSDKDALKMAKAGFWFTDKNIGKATFSDRFYPSYLSLKNPKMWRGDFWNLGKNIDKIKNAGYDGIILKDAEFGGTSYIAFDSAQIKSAISGKGKAITEIKIDDILNRVDDVKEWAKRSYENPKPVLDAIENYKAEINQVRGETITPKEAQKLKQGIYKRLTDSAYGEVKGPEKEMSKAFARGIKEELVNKYPELQQLNAKDSALIELDKILEKSVNRIRNKDVMGLADYGGAISGAELASGPGAAVGLAMAKILRSPAVLSRLSFALKKASTKLGRPILQRAIGYPLGKAAASGADVEGAINTAMGATATPAQALTVEQSATQAYLDGDHQSALRLFQQAIRTNPKNAAKYKTAINQILQEIKGLRSRNIKLGNGV